MKTLLAILLLAACCFAKEQSNHAYIIPGKIAAEWTFHDENRVWLTIVTSNHRDWAEEGYHPSFTSVIVKDYKPIVHKRADGAWEVTFASPIAELGDGIP